MDAAGEAGPLIHTRPIMDHRTPRLRLTPPKARRAGQRPLARRSIPEELAAALRERILSGELAGGSLLRQEAVAETYGVSRIPVREALRLLEGEGLVVLQVHRGALVTVHSPAQIGELFDLRAMLERDLVERAVPLATAADVAQAEAALGRADAAYAQGDVHAWGRLNTEFHLCLYRPSRREQTLALLASICLTTERYIRLYHRLIEESAARARTDHAELLRLYRAREAKAAGELLERHVQFTRRTLVEALEARLAAQGQPDPVPARR